MNRSTALVAASAALLMAMCGLLAVPLVTSPAYACGQGTTNIDPSAAGTAFDGWSPLQVTRAAQIVATGSAMNVPPRGWVIALATAMQESTLRNLANDNPRYPLVVEHSLAIAHDGVGRDNDSVGLFQQRPNRPEGEGSWGTVAELMNPTAAARKFYAALARLPDWQTMTVDDAAQSVQRSATPGAYAKWEAKASRLAAHVSGLPNLAEIGGGPPGAECGPGDGAAVSAEGWALPAFGAIVSGFRTTDRPTHDGTDIGAARNASIYAAAAGTVITSMCNASTGNCDIDGSPAVTGCGWYVEIAHPGGITTRYCHMVRAPYVHVGDQVAAGQAIGHVGSSGNSSGPHLHFEVHVGVAQGHTGSSNDAVNPVDFMNARGVHLGQTQQ